MKEMQKGKKPQSPDPGRWQVLLSRFSRFSPVLLPAAFLVLLAGCEGTGDRVLVTKCLYDSGLSEPRRFDVVVFKFPELPLKKGTPTNYIKRLLGLPGQILAIFFGQLFCWDPEPGELPPYEDLLGVITKPAEQKDLLKMKIDHGVVVTDVMENSPAKDTVLIHDVITAIDSRIIRTPGELLEYIRQAKPKQQISLDLIRGKEKKTLPLTLQDPKNLWKKEFQHSILWQKGDVFPDKVGKWFREGRFKIIRKPPDVMLAMRRIVFDNDFQPEDLKDNPLIDPRWKPSEQSGWKEENGQRDFRNPGATKTIDWLRYQHLLRPRGPLETKVVPQLITDFMDYNSRGLQGQIDQTPGENWVGDLMLECRLQVEKAQGNFFLELSRGKNRFRARWNLETGVCTLIKVGPNGEEEMASADTPLKKPGSYQLRLANFDSRLTVWVDRELPFGDGRDYPPPEVRNLPEDAKLTEAELIKRRGPDLNDLQPASIGSQGAAVKIQNLRLWRDTHYTVVPHIQPSEPDIPTGGEDFWSDSKKWDAFQDMPFRTMYVQPGHYLCLGDNSPASSDGRDWGLVPERLMLGRALMVYFPMSRIGPIR